MHEKGYQALAAHLDALSTRVAALIDLGDDTAAWGVTEVLEAHAGTMVGGGEQPPSPVIGRRFAMAHRVLLERQATGTLPSTGVVLEVDATRSAPATDHALVSGCYAA